MEDLFGILLFILFFVVLPALDKRGRKRRRQAEAESAGMEGAAQPRPRPRPERAQTTFERSRAEAGSTSTTTRERESSRSGGLSDLWEEIERLSHGGLPAPPPRPVPVPEPPASVEESEPDWAAYNDRPELEVRPPPVVPTGIDTRRRPVPSATPPPSTRHLHRRGIGQRRSKAPLLRRSNLLGADLRRAIVYREVLGPPVSLREGIAPTDADG